MKTMKDGTVKVTAKDFREAPEYALYIDYKKNMDVEYKALESRDLISAMNEAEEFMNDGVYLLRILQKKSIAEYGIDYEAVICCRTNNYSNWHVNDESHGEQNHMATYYNDHRGIYEFWIK